MIGYFKVLEFLGDEDVAGHKTKIKVSSQMNENILGILWLPPHLRKGQSQIDTDSIIYGLLDETTGQGVAMVGLSEADYGYFFDADIDVKKKLTVDGKTSLKDELTVTKKLTASDKIEASGDIASTGGDVKAGSISLKNHTHAINAATFTGTIDPVSGSATGTISGNTEVPT